MKGEIMTDKKDVSGVDPKTWGAFDQRLDKVTGLLRKALPGLIPILFGASCIPVANSTPTVEVSTLPTGVGPAALSPEMALTPYQVEAAEGEFSEAQQMINDSQGAIDQKARIQRWLDYWVNFNNRPFALNDTEIRWQYLYDDPLNPTEVMVLLEAGGYDTLLTSPLGADGFADFPPEVTGDDIQTGFGPLQLSPGEEGLWLSVQDGIPVRKDGNSNVVMRLNMETGQWEEVELIKGIFVVDSTPASYPLGGAQESFEKGDYNAGMETIRQWVSVWEKMGVFAGLEAQGNSLNPVPLDGRARIVCVDTNKQGTYSEKLLCPPLDLINGGLKAVPADGNWDETDMPLVITFERLEELTTRGSGAELVYQYVDKYQHNKLIKYVDPKTGQFVDGEYQVPGGEIKLPEIVPESMNQIEELRFNMEFKDPKAAYRMLLETVVGDNLRNEQFWQETLGVSTPTVDQLLAYARNNSGGPENKAYWLPFNTSNGTKFNFIRTLGHDLELRMINFKTDGVYIDGIYSMFFIGKNLGDLVFYNFLNGIKLDNLQNSMGIIRVGSDQGDIYEEFGMLFMNDRFIYVSGGEMIPPPENSRSKYLLGGIESVFRPERDPAIVSAQFLSYLDAMADYDPKLNFGSKRRICTVNPEVCTGGVFSDTLSPDDWVVKAITN